MNPELAKRLPDWKHRWGKVYQVGQGADLVVFRALTLGEYTQYGELVAKSGDKGLVGSEAQDYLLRKCILWPDGFDPDDPKLIAGTAFVTAQKIIQASGFGEGFRPLYERYKKTFLADGISTVFLLLCKAFPGLLPSTIESWDCNTLLRNIFVAEELLQVDMFQGPRNQKAAQQAQMEQMAAEQAGPMKAKWQHQVDPSSNPHLRPPPPDKPTPIPEDTGYIDVTEDRKAMMRALS